jgi:hypothetical protein
VLFKSPSICVILEYMSFSSLNLNNSYTHIMRLKIKLKWKWCYQNGCRVTYYCNFNLIFNRLIYVYEWFSFKYTWRWPLGFKPNSNM